MRAEFSEYWNKIYARNGRRVIATRTKAADYFSSGHRDYRALLNIAGSGAPLGRVLDIGAGDGRMDTWIAEDAVELVCIEPASDIAAECRRTLAGKDNVQIIVGSEQCLDQFRDGTFDLIYSWCVFQHISDRPQIEAYLRHSTRLLSSTGTVVHQFRLRTLYAIVHQVCTDILRIPTPMPKFGPHWRGGKYSLSELEMLASSAVQKTHTFKISQRGLHAWLTIRPKVDSAPF